MKKVLRNRVRRRVLINLKTGDAFRGVYLEDDTRALVLVNAEHLHTTDAGIVEFVPADGEIVILMTEVAYFQFL